MAATFFGEVVRAPCRAGTEDEEEEEEEGRRETPEDGEVRQQLARKRLCSVNVVATLLKISSISGWKRIFPRAQRY
ncbi:proteasome assembly chaperone 1 isoform 6-T6 [Megaptera novaeangliae]